jgi:hypothetical protein
MGLTAKATGGGGDFKPVPAGMHLARCYRIIDLGSQKSDWQGKQKISPKVMIQWEVHSEDDEGKPLVTDKNEPMTISKNYTVSLGENARLRIDLKSWRGRDFNLEELSGFHLRNVLGSWCMLTVTRTPGSDGKEYSNVTAVSPVPASIKRAGLPEGHNEKKFFDLDNPDMALFDTFSDKLKAKIMSAPEWPKGSPAEQYQKEQNKSAKSGTGFDDMDDDIPFN